MSPSNFKQTHLVNSKRTESRPIRNPDNKSVRAIIRLEHLLKTKQFTSGGIEKRVRVYAYFTSGDRRLIFGVLAWPNWHESAYNPRHTSDDPLSWQIGYYVVPLMKMPSKVNFQVDTSCSYIRIEYDIDSNKLNPNGCFN